MTQLHFRPDPQLALDMWAAGADVNEIADTCGYLETKNVRKAIARYREKGDPRAVIRGEGWRKGRYSQSYWRTVELWKMGVGDLEIAERLGLTVSTIQTHVTRAIERGHLARRAA